MDEPKTVKVSAKENDDLSAEIVRTIAREPREEVTCRRISQYHYRCNWWAAQSTKAYDNPSMDGLLVTTSRICKSKFLRVTKTDQGLQFADVKS